MLDILCNFLFIIYFQVLSYLFLSSTMQGDHFVVVIELKRQAHFANTKSRSSTKKWSTIGIPYKCSKRMQIVCLVTIEKERKRMMNGK